MYQLSKCHFSHLRLKLIMNITQLLHHRPPYLLVHLVLQHDNNHLSAVYTPSGEEFFMRGHFPGSPVVPGAILQEMTTQAAGLLVTQYFSPVPNYDSESTKGWALGVLRGVDYSKFKSFARPHERLVINVELKEHIENQFYFKGQITKGETVVMNNAFTLINIEEHKLIGISN